jgi:hypothetical protein
MFILEDIFNCSNTRELVASAKKDCDIIKPNSEMIDDEIRAVMLHLASSLPDTTWKDGDIILGKDGINLLLFLTLSEFPEFYQKRELGQYN